MLDDYSEVHEQLEEIGYGLKLNLGLGIHSSVDVKSAVLKSVLTDPHDMTYHGCETVYLPGLDRAIDKSEESVNENKHDDDEMFFHRNMEGEVVFNKEEAERASEITASSDLEERVKAALQRKRFVLPQQTDDVYAFFCNETVYGRINVLWVCGLIRMKRGTAPNMTTNTKIAFDVWPSDEANKKMTSVRSQIKERVREYESSGAAWYDDVTYTD